VIGIEDILKCVESEETGHTAQQKSKISVQMNEGTAPRCYLGGFVSIDPIHNSEETDMWTSEQSSSSSKDAVSQLQKGRTVVQMAEDPCITSQKLGCTNRKEKNCQESLRTTYKVVEPYKGKKDLASKSLSEAMTSKEEEYFENKFELLAKPGAPPYTIKEIIEESRTEIKYHGCRDLIYKRYRFWRKKKGLSPSGYKRGVITQQVRERIKEYCKLKREGHNVSIAMTSKEEEYFENKFELLAKPGAPPYTIKEIIEESRTEIKYQGCRDLIYKKYRFWRKKKGLSPSGYKRGVITQQVRERIKEYCKLKREGHNVSMRSFHQKLKNEKIYEGSYEYLCEKIKKFEESDEWGPSIV